MQTLHGGLHSVTNRLVSYYVLGMLTVVDRAWRKGLQDLIPSKDNQITVYHHLRVLLQETEEAQFRVTLQEFLIRNLSTQYRLTTKHVSAS